jgi:hypothetical protein
MYMYGTGGWLDIGGPLVGPAGPAGPAGAQGPAGPAGPMGSQTPWVNDVDANNFNLTNLDTVHLHAVSYETPTQIPLPGGTATLNVTGLGLVLLTAGPVTSVAGLSGGVDDSPVELLNVSGAAVSILNQSSSAVAGARIYSFDRTGAPGTFPLSPNQALHLVYVSGNWYMTGHS